MALLSSRFFLLLAIAVLVFHALPLRVRRIYLLVLSYAFYATWGLSFTAILLGSTCVAFAVARRMRVTSEENQTRTRGEQLAFAAAVAVLLLPLLSFKYLPPIGLRLGLGEPIASLIAPLGISYYTFRLIAYVADVWWGKLAAERNFLAFSLYVSFFPQIVSGPIQRPGDFLQQTQKPKPVPPEMIRGGLRLLLFGLFEKLVVADHLADVVNNVFDKMHAMSGVAFVLGAYAFAFQLYADFSGLTNIAIGVGRLFGVEGPPNFDNPFYSPNLQAFWRRWHISLTSWLSDYLFTPLHMALRSAGNFGLVGAIFINMIAVGLWHGAKGTFLVFGLLNGLYVAVSALTLRQRNRWFKSRPALARTRALLGPLATFHLVVLAFIFFRSSSLADALYFLRHLWPGASAPGSALGLRRMGLSDQLGLIGIACIPLMELVHLARSSGAAGRFLRWSPTWLRWSVYYAAILLIVLLGQTEARKFIYEQF